MNPCSCTRIRCEHRQRILRIREFVNGVLGEIRPNRRGPKVSDGWFPHTFEAAAWDAYRCSRELVVEFHSRELVEEFVRHLPEKIREEFREALG